MLKVERGFFMVHGINSQNVSQILRITNRCGNSDLVDKLVLVDSAKLNALLKAKRITQDLVSFATTQDDLVLLERVIKLLNNRFSLCEELIEVANDERKCEILHTAIDYINVEDFWKYFKPALNAEQYYEILKGLQRGIYYKRILYYASSRFDAGQMCQIRKAFQSGVEDRHVKVIAESGLSANLMRQMRKGFEFGLSKSKVYVYAHDFFNEKQMNHIRKVLEQNFSIEFVCFIASPEYTAKQMGFIREGFESGLSIEEVESYISLPQEKLIERLRALQEKKIEEM